MLAVAVHPEQYRAGKTVLALWGLLCREQLSVKVRHGQIWKNEAMIKGDVCGTWNTRKLEMLGNHHRVYLVCRLQNCFHTIYH